MKPIIVADEMFPEGAGGSFMELDDAGGSSSSCVLMDLAANEKEIHSDFFKDFGDLYDETLETSKT